MGGCSCCVHERVVRMLIVAEILRWLVIIIPLYLGIWRYGEHRGYTHFVTVEDDDDEFEKLQFWGIISAIILGLTLLVYVPIKVVVVRKKIRKNKFQELKWRPSILSYIMLCAIPVLIMILIAALSDREDEDKDITHLHSTSVVVLQIMVMGLTLTEWISKLRTEHLTFDLVSAMANDFFFAFDVIDFIMMATEEESIFGSNWLYVCFVFSFVAMFQYIPAQPVNITGEDGPRCRTAILVSMFCCDVPFVIIRLWTMIIFNFRVSDLLHPVKNVALIVFDIMQLVIIHKYKGVPEPPEDICDGIIPQVAPQNRRHRRDDDEDDGFSPFQSRSQSGWDLIRRRVLATVQPENQSGNQNTAFDDGTELKDLEEQKRGFRNPGEIPISHPAFT